MEKDYTEKVIEFMEQLQKLGEQLEAAQNQQKFMISRLLELKKDHQTDTKEYTSLSIRSKALQDMIDKWRPIYLEKLEMVKDVKKKKK